MLVFDFSYSYLENSFDRIFASVMIHLLHDDLGHHIHKADNNFNPFKRDLILGLGVAEHGRYLVLRRVVVGKCKKYLLLVLF